MGVGGQSHAPTPLLPGEIPGTHCIGGWGPIRLCAGKEGCTCHLGQADFHCLTQQPSRRFTSAVRTFGNGFVKRHDKSLVCVVVDAVVVLYQQELAGASGGQKLNALQEITLGR
jgi:hypothetical protein